MEKLFKLDKASSLLPTYLTELIAAYSALVILECSLVAVYEMEEPGRRAFSDPWLLRSHWWLSPD